MMRIDVLTQPCRLAQPGPHKPRRLPGTSPRPGRTGPAKRPATHQRFIPSLD